jgi:hypothetical protein
MGLVALDKVEEKPEVCFFHIHTEDGHVGIQGEGDCLQARQSLTSQQL